MLDRKVGTKALGREKPGSSVAANLLQGAQGLGQGLLWTGLTAKTPSGLLQRNKESHYLSQEPASLLAPGHVTASGVRIQVGRAKSQLSGHREEGKKSLAQTSWRPPRRQSSSGDSPQGHCPPWQVGGPAPRLQEKKGSRLSLLSTLVPRGLALSVTLVSQQLQHLHGLELALLLTLGFSLSLELYSKEQRHSARREGSTEGGTGPWPVSLSRHAATKDFSQFIHQVMTLYPASPFPVSSQAGTLHSQLCNPWPTLRRGAITNRSEVTVEGTGPVTQLICLS